MAKDLGFVRKQVFAFVFQLLAFLLVGLSITFTGFMLFHKVFDWLILGVFVLMVANYQSELEHKVINFGAIMCWFGTNLAVDLLLYLVASLIISQFI